MIIFIGILHLQVIVPIMSPSSIYVFQTHAFVISSMISDFIGCDTCIWCSYLSAV